MSKLRDERGRKRRRGRAVEGSIEMGRKAGVMRVNPKHLTRRTMPCFQEMLVFLSCLHKFNYDDDKVVKEKNALNICMDVQAKQGKQHNTINYHLQRISRTMKGAG
ncbi:hypothetical protein CY35_08G126900 [Sphagnum magellanicum]|nr:hypothetical protein CY35_08G126900 [Sphagnum magellanicum]